ncbi:hypothetical protein THRCLA_23437, partial [Thraustotheca clavata]
MLLSTQTSRLAPPTLLTNFVISNRAVSRVYTPMHLEENSFYQYSSSADATSTSEAFTKRLVNALDTVQMTQTLENSASWSSTSSINRSFIDESSHTNVNRAFSRQSLFESKASNESIGYGAISTRLYSNTLTDSQPQFTTEKSNRYIRSLSSLEIHNSPRESASTPLLGRSSSKSQSNRLQSTSRSSRLDTSGTTIELPKLKKSSSILSRGLSSLGLIQPAVKPAPVAVGEDDHGPITTSIINEVSVKIDPLYPTDESVLLKREWCAFFCGMLCFSLRFFAVQLTMDVELIFFGHLGTRQLAGAGLARLWIFVLLSFFQFTITAMQPLFRRHGTWLQTALVLCVPATPFLTFYYFHIDNVIQQTMYNPITARFAREYATLVTPGILPLLIFCVLAEFLLAHRIIYPVVAFATIACITTISLHFLLVFGYHNWPGFGFAGSPYATIITICVQLFLLYVYAFLIKGYHREKWVSWTRECYRWGRLVTVWTIAAPSGISALLMNLVFAIIGSAACYAPPKKDGRRLDDEVDMGSEQAAAWVVSLCFFFLIVSFLRGAAATTSERMEYHLAHKNQMMAKKVLFIGAAYGGFSGLLFAALVYYFAAPIFCIWSSDLVLLQMCFSAIRWIAACIAIISVRLVFAAGLTTLGQPHALSVALHIDSWLVQVPLSLILVILLQWGLEGLWISRLCGELVHTCFLMYALVVELGDKEVDSEEALPLLPPEPENLELPEPISILSPEATPTRDLPSNSISELIVTEEKEEINESEGTILVKLPSGSPSAQENLHWMRKQSSDGSVKWVATDEGILSPITEEKSAARDLSSKPSSIASTPTASKALASPKHEQFSSDESRSLNFAPSESETPKWVRQENADGSVQWIAVEPSSDNHSEDLSMDFSTSNSVKSSFDLTSEPYSSANSSIVLQSTPLADINLDFLSIDPSNNDTCDQPPHSLPSESSLALRDEENSMVDIVTTVDESINLGESSTLAPTQMSPLHVESNLNEPTLNGDIAFVELTSTDVLTNTDSDNCQQEKLSTPIEELSTNEELTSVDVPTNTDSDNCQQVNLSTPIGELSTYIEQKNEDALNSTQLQCDTTSLTADKPSDSNAPDQIPLETLVMESVQSQIDNHDDQISEQENSTEMPPLNDKTSTPQENNTEILLPILQFVQDCSSGLDQAEATELVELIDESQSLAPDNVALHEVLVPEKVLAVIDCNLMNAIDSAISDNTSSRKSSVESLKSLIKLDDEALLDCESTTEQATTTQNSRNESAFDTNSLDNKSQGAVDAVLGRVSSSEFMKSVESAKSIIAEAAKDKEVPPDYPEMASSVEKIASSRKSSVELMPLIFDTSDENNQQIADDIEPRELLPLETLEPLEIIVDSMNDKEPNAVEDVPIVPQKNLPLMDSTEVVEIIIDSGGEQHSSTVDDSLIMYRSATGMELTDIEVNEDHGAIADHQKSNETSTNELTEIVVVSDSSANNTSTISAIGLSDTSARNTVDMAISSKKKKRHRSKKKVSEPEPIFNTPAAFADDNNVSNSRDDEQLENPVSNSPFTPVQASISYTSHQPSRDYEFLDEHARQQSTYTEIMGKTQTDTKVSKKRDTAIDPMHQHAQVIQASKSILIIPQVNTQTLNPSAK